MRWVNCFLAAALVATVGACSSDEFSSRGRVAQAGAAGSEPTTGGSGQGNTGGMTGGTGGVECAPLPSCNWCGGDPVVDNHGCTTGWVCANGADPCVTSPCQGIGDCGPNETCGPDMLCWPAGTGGTGGDTGGTGGTTGGTGGVECPPLAYCNWCGGDPVVDNDGCTTGWVCANGADPCVTDPCQGIGDCGPNEQCGTDMLCWPVGTGGTGGTGGATGGTGGTGGTTGGTGGTTGGTGGTTGGTGGTTGGTGGTGGCPPLPSCNWCGGDALMDNEGCITGWICANGIDPCVGAGCLSPTDCGPGETCDNDMLCWPIDPATASGQYDWVGNPCTTDPCLPGLVGAAVSAENAYILVVDGHWIWTQEDWSSWTGHVPQPGEQVVAQGRVSYHTDVMGHVYLELELVSLNPAG